MITKIWLKHKTAGHEAIEYPDCFPQFGKRLEDKEPVTFIFIMGESKTKGIGAQYMLSAIARIEFRP